MNVNDTRPTVTVIIPHRETESIDETLHHVSSLSYPQEKIEVFRVTGNQPSAQRNACIREAKGEFVYFLDNDSEPVPDALSRAVDLFEQDERIAVVGGPNLPKESDTQLQKEFSYCLTSRFGVGPVAGRYGAKGEPREATDKDLILCNLLVRKRVLDEVGVFNEDLYPNEENELMDRVVKAGYTLYYHPGVAVARSARPTMSLFIRMLLNYGRGRFEQTILAPSPVNFIFFLPAGWVVYLLALPFLPLLPIPSLVKTIALAPVCLYAVLLLAFSVFSFFKLPSKRYRAFFMIPFIIFCIHAFYGVGIYYGAVKKLVKRKKFVRVNVTRVKTATRTK